MRDLERERAAHALAAVQELAEESARFRASYRSYVDRFGGAVVMTGLGQALATELAATGPDTDREDSADGEDKKAHRALAGNVAAWLCRPGGVYSDASDALTVMTALTTCDQTHYLRAQTETLAWLAWHKKFCHARFPRRKDDQ